jgi:putative membrane protein
MENSNKFHIFLLIFFIIVFIWSAVNPKDYFTWFLEVLPAVIGLVILIVIYKRFKFSNTTYFFIFVQASILLIGGHYTYAEVPIFNWIRDTFNLSRNHFDRLGHFFQGFTPALITCEILIRKKILNKKNWIPFLVISICLAISAAYEFFEWGTALATGDSAAAFLGTQGDVWDTQWDMFMALIGASAAMLIYFKRYRDKFHN